MTNLKTCSTYLREARRLGLTPVLYETGKDLGVFSNTVFDMVSLENYDQSLMSEAALIAAQEGVFSSIKDRVKNRFLSVAERFTAIKQKLTSWAQTDYADTAKICTYNQVADSIKALEDVSNLLATCTPFVKQQMLGSENGHNRIVSTITHGVDTIKWPFGEFDLSRDDRGELSISQGSARLTDFSEMAAEYPKPLKDLGWTPQTVQQTRQRFISVVGDVNRKWGVFSHLLISVELDTDSKSEQTIQASYGSLVALDGYMKMVANGTTSLIQETFSQIYKRAETYSKKA